MITGICHFYNEEYLLPYWINHHKRIFDHIIFIDYHSTDRSVDIIKDLSTNYTLITSRNDQFSARSCDEEVLELEWKTEGYKIALNVTEFLLGNPKKMIEEIQTDRYFIPVYPMIDSIADEFTDIEFPNESLVGQRMNGINFERGDEFFSIRKARSLHKTTPYYPTGRHYNKYNTTDCVICWYGYSPFNEHTIKRKLQIQNMIPLEDKKNQLGREHIIDRVQLITNLRHYQQHAEDLSSILEPKLKEVYEI